MSSFGGLENERCPTRRPASHVPTTRPIARMASASTSDDGPREVIPDLFIGAMNSAFTATALDALRISHLLNCTLDVADPERTPPFGSWRVPVADDVHAPLHEHLEGAVAYLDAALTSGGRVCAFCHDGRSTAPAVVAFYLMRRRQMSLAAALDAIYAVRPDAQPNVGFWQRLVEAESWLRGGEDGDGEAPAAAVVDGPPSVSLQQYKWRFLRRQQQERAKPNEPMETEEAAAAAEARARAAMMQQLELGKAEVAELIRVNSEASWTSAGL